MSRLTCLHPVHERLGASFTDFAGWQMPVRYTSDLAEHAAVRTRAGLFDLSHMGEIEVTGPQAGEALDRALVSRPSAIGVGRARYSMLCAEDGGILDDLVVYRLGETHFLVVANAGNVATVADALSERSAGFDADVRDRSDEWALVALQGPAAAAILASVTDTPVDGLRYYAIDRAVVADGEVLVARTGYTGEDGFEIYCSPAHAPQVWAVLTAAGEEHGLVPAGLACRDSLRLEAGMPLYGHELTRDTTPFQAGLGRVVDLDKPGGFVGDGALRDRVGTRAPRVLVGLSGTGRRSPRPDQAVLDRSGRPVGTVTSGAPSPTLGHPIALAYVDPECSEPATPLVVDIRGSHHEVVVCELPFYRRSR